MLRACKALEERGVNIPSLATGKWRWRRRRPESVAAAGHVDTSLARLADGYADSAGPVSEEERAGVEEILAASCRRIGLPEPVGIEHGPYSDVEGVSPVPAFRLQRTGEERARWGVHARLEFEEAVRGPILLGSGRFFGMGLMRPDWEGRTDGRD